MEKFSEEIQKLKIFLSWNNRRIYYLIQLVAIFLLYAVAYNPECILPHSMGEFLIAETIIRCSFFLFALYLTLELCRYLFHMDRD